MICARVAFKVYFAISVSVFHICRWENIIKGSPPRAPGSAMNDDDDNDYEDHVGKCYVIPCMSVLK